MTATSIVEFCDKHGACRLGREWALSTGCATMRELWDRDDIRPDWRLWIATRDGVMSERDIRMFASWCVRQVWHLLTDERSKHAVDVAERFAQGNASRFELETARAAALDAARDAAVEALAAARESAQDAAWAAAQDAAQDAARDAAWAAAWASEWESAREAQSTKVKTYKVNL